MGVVKFDLFGNRQLSCALIKNLKNASEFKKLLVAGKVHCAVIKPCLIVDLFQICVAANKAVLAESHRKLTTKSLYTEILFNLSVSKKISQSLLQFGIDEKDSEVLVVSLEDDIEVANILTKIEGNVVDISQLKSITNEKAVCKAYKISDIELSVSSIVDVVVSKISTKDFVNF